MSVNLRSAEAEDPESRLAQVLERLTTYYPRAIDPNLARSFRLLRDLGSPHERLPPVIHIAGTNGKGSTLAAIRAIARAGGMSCHVMTSPHLVRFNERIVVADHEIETPRLIELLEETERLNAGQETTSFELTTAAGLLAFSQTPADLCLLETGMGGRLDATNVVTRPLATVITVISYDHTQFLGTTLPQIAGEKVAIMKQETPAIIGPQTPQALRDGVMQVFEDHAEKVGAKLYRHGYEWSFEKTARGFVLHSGADTYEFPRPNLIGAHQIANTATAAMTLLTIEDKLPKPLGVSAFDRGIGQIAWPGRLQRLTSGELPALLPQGWELWLDGGHNDTGGQVLSEQAQVWAAQDGKPLTLVLGMLNTKDPRNFAAPLKPHIAGIYTLTIPDQPLSLSAEDLAEQIGGRPCASAVSAVQEIVAAGSGAGRILIAGSLYQAGYILRTSG